MDYNILRENDIRGEYPSQVNGDVAYIIGQAFGTYLKNNLSLDDCIVGHDNRLSSDELNETLIKGIISTGVNVTSLGLLTTPMFNYACISLENPYGIMITASHNKASNNGFKVFGENYLHLEQSELVKLYDIIKSNNFISGAGKVNHKDITNEYIEMIISKFPRLNKRVVVDCGNGTPSIIVKKIYSRLLTDVTYINCESDGSFPIHNPDPNVEENLKLLQGIVKLKGADVGIGIDGDGDRVGIIDENGNMISTDYLVAVFADEIIPNADNKKVIIDVKCSKAIEEEIKNIGGEPIMVKNGSAYLEKVIHDTPTLIGGEYSGHVFFRDNFYGFDDGIYAGLRFIELISNSDKKASELTQHMKHYCDTPEIRLQVDDNIKDQIVEHIKEYAQNKNYDVNLSDGVRVNYDSGFSLVRASNTGPYLTLRFEAENPVVLEEHKKEFMDLINKYYPIKD